MGRKRKQRKSPRKKHREHVPHIKDHLTEFFLSHPEDSFSYRQLIKMLGIRDSRSKDVLKDLLFSMEARDQIRRKSDGRWVSAIEADEYKGKVDHVNPRFAYIICDDLEEDVWVRTDDLNFAIHDDIVQVRITKRGGIHHRPEGRVTRLIQRTKDEFVGRIEISNKYSFVVPDNRNIHFDIFIFPEDINKARHNDKVVVQVKKWHDIVNRSPVGKVIKSLGPAGENEAEIHSIMAEFGLPFQFPDRVEKAADEIPIKISASDIKDRKDFREITTFTIDPVDAKDFDDALSFKKIGEGKFEVGIHIADVTHYVKFKDKVDVEAQDRATSVYLVDRTIPMLPEKLSNELCSLRPREDKMAFSAVFDIDMKGKVSKRWFGRTVINSDCRFTYEEAQECLETGTGDFANELAVLNEIAHGLRQSRFDHGAINFETIEVQFELDDKGKPVSLKTKERKDAHKLIEEFMLLANREVATYIFNRREGKKLPGDSTFVYRIHDNPDPEKLQTFSSFASRFGHKVSIDGNVSVQLNRLMEAIEGKPEQNVLESLAIRSMAKARYTTESRGHFGLAFDHYTHFTSPIRRYPDVMVHRLLWHYLQKEKSPEKEPYEKLCVHSSEREKRAADAERASVKYKQVEFMTEMLGETFEGIVSGVTEWGVFVEIIETKCEGMIRISELDDDYYEYDEKQFRIVGKRNRRVITLGDKLFVQVVKTDIDRRTIDLLLVDEKTHLEES